MGKKKAGFKQGFHYEERHFPSLGTGMALKLFNIVINNLIKVLKCKISCEKGDEKCADTGLLGVVKINAGCGERLNNTEQQSKLKCRAHNSKNLPNSK